MHFSKVKRAICSDFLIAVAFSLATALVCYIFSGFTMRYCSNDGYSLSLLVVKGDQNQLFLNYFLTAVLIPLQKVFDTVNIYVITEVLLCFVSFCMVNYCLLKKFKKPAALFLMAVVAFLFADLAYVFEQFNQMTVIMAASGLLSIYASFIIKEKKRVRITLRCFGIFMTIVSSAFRFTAFETAVAVFAVFVCCVIFTYFWRLRNTDPVKKGTFNKTIRKYGLMAVTFIITAAVSFTGYYVSEHIKLSSDSYSYYKSYNYARSSVVDYECAPYDGNEEFYNSLGYNNNDIVVLNSWFGDEQVFTIDKMTAISDYASQPEMKLRFTVRGVLSDIKQGIASLTGMNPYLAAALGGLLLLITGALLFVFRNKLKLLFPIILTGVWAAFLISFNFTIETALALPLAVFICASAFLCNRYYFFTVSVLSAVVILLMNYLNMTRINFRSSIVLFFTTVLCVFFLSGREYLRKSVANSPLWGKTAMFGTAVAALLVAAFFAQSLVWNWFITINNYYNEELYNKIDGDNSKAYAVCGTFSLNVAKNYERPLLAPEIPDRALLNCSWLTGSDYIDEEEVRFGVTNLYSDIIDNDGLYFVINKNYIKDMEKFFNDNYAADGEKINVIVKETIENDLICSVATQQ